MESKDHTDKKDSKDMIALLKNPNYNPDPQTCELILSWACMHGFLDVVRLVDAIHPEINKDKAFKFAAMQGYDIVRYLLSKFNPALEDNVVIRYAGNAEVARLLPLIQEWTPRPKIAPRY